MTSEIKVDTISENTSANGVAIDGLTIKDGDITATTLTVDASGEINLDADDGKVRLKDGGTEVARFVLDNGSGDLEIVSSISDKDIKLRGKDGSSNVTALTLDMSDAGAATLNNGLTLTDGNITFAGSGHGIHLGVTSATAANLLDDYEVGTFTPTLATTGTDFSSIGYATQTGEYVKVGDLVIAHARVTLNSFTAGSPSGNAVISGLPFTSKDTTDMASSIGFVSNINFDISSFGTIDVGATTSANNTRLNLTRTRNNGVADGVPHQAVTSSSTSINAVAIYKTA